MTDQEWSENDEIQAQSRINKNGEKKVEIRYVKNDAADRPLVPSESFHSFLERIRDENKH